ncbi:MAG TPA: hypothetical protein VK957_05085 [Lunatimonas sp.]|nr:hypothetical protein [Lunatimonas sp.]
MAKVIKNPLSTYGYNLIALPKEGIAPLLLLYKNNKGVSSLENSLIDFFAISDSPPPSISKENKIIDIKGDSSVSFEAEGGINVLDWLLQKLRMGKLAGNLKIESAHQVQISYENVTEDKVSLLDLDNFISGSEPQKNKFNTFKEKLENSELFVVNSILKSDSFSVSAADQNGHSVDIEGNIKGVVDANVEVSKQTNHTILLKYEKADPIVFAFKAQRIIYDKKKWWEFFKKDEAKFRIKDQQGVVLKNESDFPTEPFIAGNELIDL